MPVVSSAPLDPAAPVANGAHEEDGVDVFALRKQQAIDGLRRDQTTLERIRRDGVPWGALNKILLNHLPANMDGAADVAYAWCLKPWIRSSGAATGGP